MMDVPFQTTIGTLNDKIKIVFLTKWTTFGFDIMYRFIQSNYYLRSFKPLYYYIQLKRKIFIKSTKIKVNH